MLKLFRSVCGLDEANWASSCTRLSCSVLFVHVGIKIPSRTIVLQAWVSSVVSCVSNLKDGIFSRVSATL